MCVPNTRTVVRGGSSTNTVLCAQGSHTPKRPQYVGNQALSTARRTRAGQLGPTFEEQVALVVDKDTARGRKGTVRKNEAHRIQAEKHLSKKLHLDSFRSEPSEPLLGGGRGSWAGA